MYDDTCRKGARMHPYSNLTKFIVDTVNDINFCMFNTAEEKYVGLDCILKMNFEDLRILIESNISKLKHDLKYLSKMQKMSARHEQDEYVMNIIETQEDISRLEALLNDLKILQIIKEKEIDLSL
jgi:hypothetical protein